MKLCNKHGHYEEGRGCDACMQEFKQAAKSETASPALRELSMLIDDAKLRARLEQVRDELEEACYRTGDLNSSPAARCAVRAACMLGAILEGKEP